MWGCGRPHQEHPAARHFTAVAALLARVAQVLWPRRLHPGAYTPPLFSSTWALSVGKGVHLGFVWGVFGGVRGC